MNFPYFFLLAIVPYLSITAQQGGAVIVGHWPLDGNVQDLSEYSAHGIVNGDPLQVDGVISQALDFDGDDYIEITLNGQNPAHLKELSTGSISMWFKTREWNIDSTMLPLFYYGRAEGCVDAFDATNEGLIIEVGHGGIFPSENIFFTCYDQPNRESKTATIAQRQLQRNR